MKCRLKSSNAPRGVWPNPLVPVRSFGPIKASHRSPTIPILGRKRAAGLRGWLSRKFSTSSFINAGRSSIASEVTSIETCVDSVLDLRPRKQTLTTRDARTRSLSSGTPRCSVRTAQRAVPTKCYRDLISSPNHCHGSREAAAHVEREEFFRVFDLASACLFGELLIGFEDLANTSCSYGMAVADQAATCVHSNLERRFGLFRTDLRQRRCAAFHELDPFARLGEPENFVRDDFSNGKAIMHLCALQIARRQICHAKRFLWRSEEHTSE